VTARLVVKSGPRKTLRRGKKIVKTIPVMWRVDKMVAKTMQVTRVRQVTWVLSISENGDYKKRIPCII
jgi:hypothetical protein